MIEMLTSTLVQIQKSSKGVASIEASCAFIKYVKRIVETTVTLNTEH